MRSFIKSDGSIRSWDVALVSIVPAHSRPSVALILLHYRQHLPFLHGDGSLAGACGQMEESLRGKEVGMIFVSACCEAV